MSGFLLDLLHRHTVTAGVHGHLEPAPHRHADPTAFGNVVMKKQPAAPAAKPKSVRPKAPPKPECALCRDARNSLQTKLSCLHDRFTDLL